MTKNPKRISQIEWREVPGDEPRWFVEIEEFRDGRWQFLVDSNHGRFQVNLELFWQAEVRMALHGAYPGLEG